jgi:hypothetical protein
VVAAVPSFLVLINLVRHSDLAAVVPARLTEGEPDLQVQALPFAIPGFTKILAGTSVSMPILHIAGCATGSPPG